MKKLLSILLLVVAASLSGAESAPATPAAQAALERAKTLAQEKEKEATATVAAFAEVIEAEPDFMAAHEALRQFRDVLFIGSRRDTKLAPLFQQVQQNIQDRYLAWEKRWPESPGIAYGIYLELYAGEDPRAKPYLLKIVKHQPNNAKIWSELASDSERWGDLPAAAEYLLKATQLEPDNPDYAFYYASSLKAKSVDQWEAASLEVVRRFPASDRGAQALYWLGQDSEGDAKRIAFWEQCRAKFPPAKFQWSRYSMDSLFEAYIRTAPDKAFALAADMVAELKGDDSIKTWNDRVAFAKVFKEVKGLTEKGSYAEAQAALEKVAVNRRTVELIEPLKAEILAGAGRTLSAYDNLVKRFAAVPDDTVKSELERAAAMAGKSPAQVDADVWSVRDASAKAAPAFDLGLYTSDKTVSLAGLKGKVVFITFWFPGCGPCRAEFPHFESVVAKFKGNPDLVYVGINGLKQQDAYVIPFMEGTKYSFTPLKGGGIDKAYGVRGYPANFLIDREGRIIFEGFRASDPRSELVLQRMIESLLARPARF